MVGKKYIEESDEQKPDARRIIYPELVIQMTGTMDRLYVCHATWRADIVLC